MCICEDILNECIENGSQRITLAEGDYSSIELVHYPEDFSIFVCGTQFVEAGYYIVDSNEEFDCKMRVHFCPRCGGRLIGD